jgi:hypothetical protein
LISIYPKANHRGLPDVRTGFESQRKNTVILRDRKWAGKLKYTQQRYLECLMHWFGTEYSKRILQVTTMVPSLNIQSPTSVSWNRQALPAE